MIREERFEVECVKLGKNDTETQKEDSTTYRAEYYAEKEGEFVKITISSSQPLKAQLNDKVVFKKTSEQMTIMESLTEVKPVEQGDESELDEESEYEA